MRLKFFAVPALDSSAAEADVNNFVANHRVMSIERELLTERSGSFWAVCVTFLEEGFSPQSSTSKRSKIDYREVLQPAEFEIYLELRKLRKKLAESEGIPLYAVFTNEQLAAMVQRRVRTSQELSQLQGVGPARVEKYSSAFLDCISANLGSSKSEKEGRDAADSHPPG